MDLKLIERFVSSLVPEIPAAKQSVNIAFDCMKADTNTQIFSISRMIAFAQIKMGDKSEDLQVATCHGLLTGVMLAFAAEDPLLRKCIINTFLEQMAKNRGENVIGFFDKKAGK